jgi:hypothetical protein
VPLASVQVETALVVLKIAFLVILYVFIWRIVRAAARDLRLPQESMILTPQQASMLLAQPPARELGRLVVVRSHLFSPGDVYTLHATALSVGRADDNELTIPGDEYVSSHHARFEPRRDGVYLSDAGSTNGTFVNGIRLTSPRRLAPSDLITIGETEMRFER